MQWSILLRVNYVIKVTSAPQCCLNIIKVTRAFWEINTCLLRHPNLKTPTFWVDLPIPQMDSRLSRLIDLFKVDIFGPHMVHTRSFNQIRLRV